MSLQGAVLQQTYEVGELLGTGGMGDVYEASHARLNRRFAIKILHKMFAKNPEAFARFRREALVASSLGHPHIIQVVDFNTLPDGAPYIVMERLDGVDLHDKLDGEPMDVETVLHISDQLGSALAAAHSKDVVHRDLKPENIFVLHVEEDPWYIKILDFGISKIKGSTSIVTQDNSLIGTPYYMAPEQAEGRTDQIDGRTDQFALAVMLYEMLAGTNPFDADSIPSVLYHVVHTTPPPIHEVNPNVPLVLSQALERGMSKKVEDRFPSIRAFVRALRGLPEGVATGKVRVPQRPSSSHDVDPLGATTMSELDRVSAHTILPEPEAPSSGRKKWPLLAAIVGLAAIGALVAVLAGGGSDGADKKETKAETPPAPTKPAVVETPKPAVTTPPPEKKILITFAVKPAPDAITVDGEAIKGSTHEMVADGSEHTAVLTKKGYVEETVEFVADSKQTIRMRLAKTSSAEGKRRTRRAKRKASKRKKKATSSTTSKSKKTKTKKTTTKKNTKKKTKKGKFIMDL